MFYISLLVVSNVAFAVLSTRFHMSCLSFFRIYLNFLSFYTGPSDGRMDVDGIGFFPLLVVMVVWFGSFSFSFSFC
ncbi:hypothetical protein BGX38DRAFT_1171988 [Terfezia claveryi]|nr:hypothetical protein BGX38DRAFT_1171988 [Terfezia claveryi]